ALIMVPGYALATLARPGSPRVERLALAVPCAYSMVAISGLATAMLHLPFGLPAYAALALPVTLAGVWPATKVAWQRTGTEVPELVTPARDFSRRSLPCDFSRRPGGGRWWLVPAGVALVEAAVIALVYAGYVVPVGFDAI